MAMSAMYTTIGGVLYHENRGGVETEYVPDPLGSLIQCRDSSGTVTYTAEYWPYGEVRTETGSKSAPWGFVGLLGYLTDQAKRLYVRARHLRVDLGQWTTVDPLWPSEMAYQYCDKSPIQSNDPSGLGLAITLLLGYPQGWLPCPPANPTLPAFPPELGDAVRQCIEECAGSGSYESWTDCLKKCGVDDVKGRAKDLVLDWAYCKANPGMCETYRGLPCENVYDVDTCQACAMQNYWKCMVTDGPLGYKACLKKQDAAFIVCEAKYGPRKEES